MSFHIKSINYNDNNAGIQIKRQHLKLSVMIFTPKNFVIFQIFAIPHGGAESTHFLITNIRPKLIILTTYIVCAEQLGTK